MIVTDERLMAYADGELPPEEMRVLDIMLAEDPALAARLEPFAATGSPLAGMFDHVLSEPIPTHLVESIRTSKVARASRTEPAQPIAERGILDALGLGWLGGGLKFSQAFTAAGLLLTGAMAGWTAAHIETDPAAPMHFAKNRDALVASGALANALDKKPSALAAALGVTPISTFARKDPGGFCREYRIADVSGANFAGVACRDPNATDWRIVVHSMGPQAKQVGTNEFETAAGSADPAIESVIDTLIKGDLLQPADEQELIQRGWK